MNENDGNGKSSIKFILRALQSRNYRLYFMGQGVSLIGTWIQRIAQGWLVYRLTDSVFLLGIVGFSSQIPTFLAAPFAGVLVDRFSRYRILLIAQIISAIQATILATLVLTDLIQVWHIIVLGVLLGLVNSFEMPSRQSLMIDMIEHREDLSNAIALNSTMVNGARLIGPTIAGVVIGWFGEGTCFALNAVSFMAVIAALLSMNLKCSHTRRQTGKMLREFKNGFLYIYGFPPMRAILLLIALASIMGMPYAVLMPAIARDTLQGGPHTLGFLMASVGLGALSAAAFLATRRTVVGLGNVISVSVVVFGAGLVAFSFSRQLWLSMILLYFAGLGMMLMLTSSNTVLQTIVDDDKRGRLMSFFAISLFGMAPLGSLLAGSLASRIGTPMTLMLGGISCVIGGLIFMSRLPAHGKLIRPIYRAKGILPEVAEGLRAANTLHER